MRKERYKIWHLIEYLLGLGALISLFVFVHLNMSVELRDPDVWLHLKTGEYIVQHKDIPDKDIFSATASGKQWIDHSWLLQVIFYLIFHYAGPDNLILFSTVSVVLAFLFLFFSVYKRRRHLTLIVTMLFMAICASQLRFNIRPENLSILFFSVYLFLLTRAVHTPWIFLLPLVQLIWVNCHGFFILGPLLAGIFVLSEKLKRKKLLPWDWNKIDLLDETAYRRLLNVFILVCLACLINPYGYKGALYPFIVTFSSLGNSGIFYKYIQELLPTWQIAHNSISFYYGLIIISLCILLLNFRRLSLAHLLLWLIFLTISFRVSRNIIFFNFVAFLATVNSSLNTINIKKLNLIKRIFGTSTYLLNYILIAGSVLYIWRSNLDILSSRYYIFSEGRFKSSLLGLATEAYPVKAADFMLENGLPGNTFNLFNYGSYLIYRLYPARKVFIDGRTELYGEDFFNDFERIAHGDEKVMGELFGKYQVNTVFLSGHALDIGNLARYFLEAEEWVLVYFDEGSLIFLKNIPENKTLIQRLKIDLTQWQTPKVDFEKIGLKNILPSPYIKRAWMFYKLGLSKQAITEITEALKLRPSIPDAYNILARIYIQQKKYEEAFQSLRLAHIYGPRYKQTLISFGDFYQEKGELKKAEGVYKKLVKLYPYFAEGYYFLSRLYLKMENQKLAVKLSERAKKLKPIQTEEYLLPE